MYTAAIKSYRELQQISTPHQHLAQESARDLILSHISSLSRRGKTPGAKPSSRT